MMLKDLQKSWRTNASKSADPLIPRLTELFADALSPFVEREQEDMELIGKLLKWAETFNPSKTSDHPLAMKARERLKEFGAINPKSNSA